MCPGQVLMGKGCPGAGCLGERIENLEEECKGDGIPGSRSKPVCVGIRDRKAHGRGCPRDGRSEVIGESDVGSLGHKGVWGNIQAGPSWAEVSWHEKESSGARHGIPKGFGEALEEGRCERSLRW